MSVALLLLPDFLLITGGALLRRVRGFDAAVWTGIERLVYFILFPALLFRSLATSPSALGDADRLVAVGLTFSAAGMRLSALAARLLELLAGAALPLGLLAVGAGLTLARRTLPFRALAWWRGVKLVALPAIALAFAPLAGLSPVERQIAVVMAAVPTAASAYILAAQMNGHGAPVALLISSGTLLAVFTLPLWIALVG